MSNAGLGQVVSWYICTIAAVPFVILRIYSRWKRFGRPGIEDALIILALGCLIGDLGIQQHMWHLGLGDMATVTPENLKGIQQMIVPGSVLYVTSLWAVKVALVLFYKTLPAPGSRLLTAYNVALVVLAATYLTIFFDILFQCYPYDKRWSTDPNYQCSAQASNANYWMTILFNIFTDVAIICLPIAMVMRLQMKMKQKLGVTGVFCLGGFVIISSIIRAVFSHRNETMLTCTVSMVENAIAIIAACLPALRSMLIGGSTQGSTNTYGKHYELSSANRWNRTNRVSSAPGVMHTRSTKHNPNDSEDSLVGADVTMASGPAAMHHDKRNIMVETTIETSHSDKASSSKSSV